MKPDVWIGLDYGEETTAICAVDADGNPLLECLVDSDAPLIAAAVEKLGTQNIQIGRAHV